MHNIHEQLRPAFGFAFEDLYSRESLVRLDTAFCHSLQAADAALLNNMLEARKAPGALPRKQQSELMIAIAPHLEDFIGELFGIAAEVRALQAKHDALAPLYALKRKFVQKKAISGMTVEKAALIHGGALGAELESLFGEPLSEASFVEHVSHWLENEADHPAQINAAQQYAAWAALSPAGRHKHQHGVLFEGPHKLDMEHLVPVRTVQGNGVEELAWPESHCR